VYQRRSSSPSFRSPPSQVHPQTAGPAHRRADATPALIDAMRTVMLVSSDETFCTAAAGALTDAGFGVLVAPNSMDAVAILSGSILSGHSIDGLITAIRMPRGHPHGVALARLVRDQNSMSMVIFLTDEPRFVSAVGTLLNGKTAMVCPVGDVPALIRRTRTALSHGSETPGG
jgi:DNA-binding response OmpR family regulator